MTKPLLKGTPNGRVTVMDVARAAGVSYGVAADILREKTRYTYREETIARVQQTAGELSYRPSRVAQALTTGRTHQIALCLPSFGSSFVTKFIHSFDQLALKTPYDLLVSSHRALEQQDISVDGVLFYGTLEKARATSSLPMVTLGTDYKQEDAGGDCDTVRIEMKKACQDSMQHLLDQGCQRILMLTSQTMVQPSEPRFAAYTSAMQAAGLREEILPFYIPNDDQIREKIHQLLQKYFLEKGFPDALFCSNDDVAIGAYRALREAGRRIPQQTAVSGCDDNVESQDMSPSLTSIHLPINEVAIQAWKTLVERLENPRGPYRSYHFDATFVARESSCHKCSKISSRGAKA